MDWDMKTPSWDFAELERDAGLNIGSVVDSSVGLVRQRSAVDCSVDLKLGGLGDFGSSEKWKGQQQKAWSDPVATSTVAAAPSPPGPSKRARQPSSSTQNVSCLVDGCTSDLSNCREYHRRHKVCETHSKTPIVMVGGQEQRFCQQCSRFHLLAEFDEVKRSCRKRLDGHNRRRRKPQPESLSSASLLPGFPGTRFQSYPHMFPTATPRPSWTAVLKNGEDALYQQHPPLHAIDRQQFPSSYTLNFKEGKQFPFLHDNGTTISSRTIEATACQPLINTISFSGSSSNSNSNSNNKLFPDGLTQVLDSDCALSLLSSPTQTSGINLGHLVPSDRIQVSQPLIQNLQQYGDMSRYSRSQASGHVSTNGFSCSRMDDEQVAAVLVSDTGNTDLHCQGFFHLGGEGSSNGPSGSVPFSWQ